MKRREYFLYGNKTKINDFIQQLGTVTSPLCQNSAILEIIPWTQNAYTLLYQLGHKGALFAFKSERISTKKMHPCVEADTEDWDTEETLRCLIVE